MSEIESRRLGDLYDRVAVLLEFLAAGEDESDETIVKQELGYLAQKYGPLRVAWIIGVVRDDMAGGS